MMCSWAFTFPQQWDPEGICHRFPALSEAKLPRKSQTTKTSLSWLWRPRLLLLVLLLMLLSLLLLLLLLQLRFWKRLSSNCCVCYRDVQVVRAMKMSAPLELRLAIKTFLPIRYLKTIATGTALKSFFYPSPGAWTSGNSIPGLEIDNCREACRIDPSLSSAHCFYQCNIRDFSRLVILTWRLEHISQYNCVMCCYWIGLIDL